MFPHLSNELKDKGITFKAVAILIGCTEKTLQNKMNGIIDKTFDLLKLNISLDTAQKQITLGTYRRPTLTEITRDAGSSADLSEIEDQLSDITTTIDDVTTVPDVDDIKDDVRETLDDIDSILDDNSPSTSTLPHFSVHRKYQ